MVRNISVSSVETNIGKTAIALALGALAQDRGIETGYIKPINMRLGDNSGKPIDEEVIFVKNYLDLGHDIEDVAPVIYSQTFIEQTLKGRKNPNRVHERIRDSYKKLSKNKDLMIVEGSGRLNAGAIINLTDFDLAEFFKAETILVGRYTSPADLDDILSGVGGLGDHLMGLIFNSVFERIYEDVENIVVPYLENRNCSVLGILPQKKELTGVTVGELAEELKGQLLIDAPTDILISRFLVGAMSGESALRYFRRTRDTALITGGDRPDVQRVALESSGIKCLVLTGGFEPPSTIIGEAEKRGVPILMTQTDTLTTVEKVERVVCRGRALRKETVEKVRDLLVENVDLDAIFNGETS